MLEYDISGARFDYKKRYTGTRWQQGRVNIDQDNNADQEIKDHIRQRSFEDIIGSCGSPDEGFCIKNPHINENNLIDFDILSGRLYLGGLLLEIGTGKEPEGIAETYRLQQDWLNQLSDQDGVPILKEGEERCDLVYLEAWQQGVSPTEDSELLEPALGGPDTTTKVKSMRRIKMKTNIEEKDCAKAWKKLLEEWENNQEKKIGENYEQLTNANLTITYLQEGAYDDLCRPSISGEYRVAENQAIRVQLTGINEAKFTWGFDNAAPLYRVEIDGNEVKMITSPKDQHHWPLAGNIVEILPWSAVLPNGEKIAELRGHFSRVETSFDPDSGLLKLADVLPDDFGGDEWKERSDYEPGTEEYYYMRFWNRGADINSEPEISFTPGNPVPLGNTGLAVTITGEKIDLQPNYYWIIAARPHSRNDGLPWDNKVLPWELEEGMAPFGICRFYAPLAIIRWAVENGNVVGQVIHDCRNKFSPLTEREGCCTYTVGDGVHSKGDYSSIEEAITHLPLHGGKICVLPGEHLANVVITGRQNIRISGCGEHTIIRPHPDDKRIREPIFRIIHSQEIHLSQLTMMAPVGTAIVVEDHERKLPYSRNITIRDNRIMACIHAILIKPQNVAGENQFIISHNQIGMFDKPEGRAAIFSLADGVLIERNRVIVVPPPAPEDPDDPRDEEDPPDGPQDPCADPAKLYDPKFNWITYAYHFFSYVTGIKALARPLGYRAMGGIQVAGGSERVRILENTIIGGRGNGVTLGYQPEIIVPAGGLASVIAALPSGITKAAVAQTFPRTLYEISIEKNYIHRMGLSGIGVASFFNAQNTGLIFKVEGLEVYRNTITHCAQQTPASLPESMLNQAGFGGITLASCEDGIIQGNRIEDNGVSHLIPVCGIFIRHAEKMDISNNRILNNGPRATDNDAQLRPGKRGGIVIEMVIKPDFNPLEENREFMDIDGIPAVRIHNNIVVQPMGHALYIMAYGPVSVVGNQLTSQGIDTRNGLSYLAGAVFIFNLGRSKDDLRHILLKLQNIANTNALAGGSFYSKNNPLFKIFSLLPSGLTLFSNNQVMLDLRSRERNRVWSANLILSLDDVAFNSNQAEVASNFSINPVPLDQAMNNTYLYGWSVRSNDNRFQEGATLTKYSLFSHAYLNMALGNQSTHCLNVLGARRPPKAVLNTNNIILYPARCNDDLERIELHLNLPAAGEVATSP